jgi:hypothetical protein
MMSNQWFDESSDDQRKTRLVQVKRDGDDMVLRHRWGRPQYAQTDGGLLFLFWIAWTAACVFVVLHVMNEASLLSILFAVPFLAAWMLMFCVLCGIFFGSSDLRIGSNGLTLTRTVFFLRLKRHVPFDEILGISEYCVQVKTGESGRSRTELGLMIVALGKPLRFAQGIDPAEISGLIDLVRRHLDAQWDKPFPERTGPPSDSEIELVRDWDRMVFVRRYPLNLANLGVTTLVCCFWNGIVGVFVCHLVQEFQWLVFFFLIPFEVIGLHLLLNWLADLTSPWWRQEWAFGADKITSRFSILGLGRTRVYDAQQLAGVEIRGNDKVKKKLVSPRPSAGKVDRPFVLGLVNDDRADFLVLDELTGGEARWMESELRVLLKRSTSKASARLAPVPDSTDPSLWDRELDG